MFIILTYVKFQSGFWKNFSKMDNLIRLGDIRETFFRDEFLTPVFLNIKKAYDKTWIHRSF